METSLIGNINFDLIDVWLESTDGIRITDSDGKIIAANPAFCKLFDKLEEDLINQPFHLLYHPNIQTEIIKEYKDDIYHNNVKTQLERKAVLWNGRKVWFEFTNSIIKSISNDNLVLSLVRDISDKKDCQILGRSMTELVQQDPLHVIFENQEDEILKFIDRLNAEKSIIFNAFLTGKSSNRIPAEINSRLFDYNERPAILFISRDIAERRDFEEKLKQRTNQLRNLASKLQSI